MTDWLDKLNPPQRAAVLKTEGPLLVIAGAGSGKTRVITCRIAQLIRERGVAPWNILAVTFTNKAAKEMRERVMRLTAEGDHTRFAISTFHSICAGILRREAHRAGLTSRFTICDETDQRALIKDVLNELEIAPEVIQPGQAQHIINQAKLRMLGPEDVGKVFASRFEELYVRVYERYQQRLKAGDACDFEDLILHCVRIFDAHEEARRDWAARWPYLLVDEYQDTNFVQFRFLECLARERRNLCVVGDLDQCIYSWRGADIHNLLDFQRHFPEAELIRLEQNYRSCGNILSAASQLIEHNRHRIGKTLWTERPTGPPIHVLQARTDREETLRVASLIDELHGNYGLPYRELAVFYRANALSRALEDRLREFAIPYRVVGGIRFYDRAEIKDLISYLRLIVNPHNELALLRVINTPRRGIGAKTVDTIRRDARSNSRSLFVSLDVLAREGPLLSAGQSQPPTAQSQPPTVLPKAAKSGAAAFVAMIQRWRAELDKAAPSTILERVLADTGYQDSLGDPAALEALTRLENIQELKSSLLQFEKEHPAGELGDYLEMIALATAEDNANPERDCVSLMTLHSAKGLEFSVVIITALDAGIFPNQRALEEGSDGVRGLEEERRLCYVGFTRAKDLLVLTHADSRFYNGRQTWCPPSLFLRELPADVLAPLEELDGSCLLEIAAQRRPAAQNADDADSAGDSAGGGPSGVLQRPDPASAASGATRQVTAGQSPLSGIIPNQPTTTPGELPDIFRLDRVPFRGLYRTSLPQRSAGGLALNVGDLVRHPQLGAGEILNIEPVDGDFRVTLFLEDGSERAVYARHARLEVLK